MMVECEGLSHAGALGASRSAARGTETQTNTFTGREMRSAVRASAGNISFLCTWRIKCPMTALALPAV